MSEAHCVMESRLSSVAILLASKRHLPVNKGEATREEYSTLNILSLNAGNLMVAKTLTHSC